MRKASDFLSKPLISLNEGKNEGVIKNISFDLKLQTAEWLVLYDENDCDCDEKAVRISEAYAIGENAVMIKSGQAVVPAVSAPIFDNNPINCRVFTALGKLMGTVSDVILTDENRTAEFVYDDGKALPLSEIISGSRGIVVKSEGDIKAKESLPPKKVPAPKPADTKRKVKALSKEKKVSIEATPKKRINKKVTVTVEQTEQMGTGEFVASDQSPPSPFVPTINVEDIIIREEVFTEGLGIAVPIIREPFTPLIFDNGESIEIWPPELQHIPERIIASYTFLLGRKVAKNIYNSSRQLVIKADSVVSPQIVETARKYGRLVDLTKLSL